MNDPRLVQLVEHRDPLSPLLAPVRSPKSYPPHGTVYRHFSSWRDDGLWASINHYLLMEVREAEGPETNLSADIVDIKLMRTTESAGPRGLDTAK